VHTAEHEGFIYLTVPHQGLYRRIMLAFVAAKRRFTVHLRPEDVAEVLEPVVDAETYQLTRIGEQ